MNKNLKKVISAVAALAVSASSIVAFAAGYPDVPETASYAQAVSELSALGVINGYEDGTFAPDKNVTRAEITKMIVTALGSSSMSAAEAATGKDTQFNDVKGTHWASGYVTVGTSSGTQFINGYSDTEFGPDDNVTYVQAIKMLVAALGYTTYAENNGGWPNGYLSYGYSLDITKGITGVSNDTQVTRAQVAQMIDNAVKAPICVIDGYETQWNGTQTPKLVEKNQTSIYNKDTWQCLLNYSHDAYVVNGRVKATHESSDSVDTDKVMISIEKSNNYNGLQVVTTNGVITNGETSVAAYIGDSEADKYLLTYAEMIVQLDDDDELTVLSIAPVGTNKTVEFAAEDTDDDTITGTSSPFAMKDKALVVYENGSTTKTKSYKLNDKVSFYINGAPIAENIDSDSAALAGYVHDYLLNNTTGEVTLIDSPNEGTSSTDGKYDYIMVTRYHDFVVDSVIGDEEECTIYFSEASLSEVSIDVDLTDEDKYYSFTLDGAEIKPTDLQVNDVLSIAHVGTDSDFSKSRSYKVLVSRDTAEGKVTSVSTDADPTESEYTVNGTAYKIANSNLITSALTVGSEYTMYLDAFGKIAKVEETATSLKLALIDNVYEANGGQYYATIITPSGSKVTYTIKDAATFATYQNLCFSNVATKTKKAVQDRVYNYSVSTSTDNITFKDDNTSTADGITNVAPIGGPNQEYRLSSTRLGSIRLDAATSSILDLSEYNSEKTVGTVEISALEDSAKYEAYGFGKLSSNNSYAFVIITDGGIGSVTYSTDFVIFSKQSSADIDGESMVTYTVYSPASEDNMPIDLVLDSEGVAVSGLTEGDPIVVKKNSSGYVTKVYPLFATNALANGYNSFATAAREALKNAGTGATGGDMKTAYDLTDYAGILNTTSLGNADVKKALGEIEGSSSDTNSSDNYPTWIFGAVYDRTSSSVTLATQLTSYTNGTKTSDYTTDVTALREYDLDADANVLVYNYKERAGKQQRVSNGIASSIMRLIAPKAAFLDASQDTYLDWNSSAIKVGSETAQYGMTSFAFAKLVDNQITEIYVINPSTSAN